MIDVVAAVIKKDNKYFIAQRNRQKHFAYYWEFPGGKVNHSESFENALKRELMKNYQLVLKLIKKYHLKNIKMKKLMSWSIIFYVRI